MGEFKTTKEYLIENRVKILVEFYIERRHSGKRTIDSLSKVIFMISDRELIRIYEIPNIHKMHRYLREKSLSSSQQRLEILSPSPSPMSPLQKPKQYIEFLRKEFSLDIEEINSG